ncbi:hypothetical protein [Rhodococcoides corynebacterioides]|uniref:hypothetical protein n=1 Tax=Rhodococcoides corynebacterioides TaxID=53972 RepID=UPI001C9B1D5A|nr:hypothetical protein [Rhodococcus corynebacterioides]MBY6362814.1 hypothetical protein [Rhodococcus corynebacterioides]
MQTTPSVVVSRVIASSAGPVKVVRGAVVVVRAVVVVVGKTLVVVGKTVVVLGNVVVVVGVLEAAPVVVGAAVVVRVELVVAATVEVGVATPVLVVVDGEDDVSCSTFADRRATPLGATAAEVKAEAPTPQTASTRTTEKVRSRRGTPSAETRLTRPSTVSLERAP